MAGLAESELKERFVVAVTRGSEAAVPAGLQVLSLPHRAAPNAALAEAWWQERFGRHLEAGYRQDVMLALSPFLSSVRLPRSIVVCHDLIPLRFPRYLGRFMYRRWLFEGRLRWLAQSALVVTDSEFTARELRDYLGDAAPAITTIPLWTALADGPVPSESARGAVRARYRLPDRYWLYVGGYDYRKNVELLIEAFGRVADIADCPVLVLAGDIPSGGRKPVCDVSGAIRRVGLSTDQVHCPGYIATEDLGALYAGAELFVYPSLSEGFGFPPVEAMASGCPAIVADETSLPEVVTDASYRFQVREASHLTELLRSAARKPFPLNPGFDRRFFGSARGLPQYLRAIEQAEARLTPGAQTTR